METLKVMKASPNTLVKMKKGPGRPKKSEAIIKDVKHRTKNLFKNSSQMTKFLKNKKSHTNAWD